MMRMIPTTRDLVQLEEALTSLNLKIEDYVVGHVIEGKVACSSCHTHLKDEAVIFMIKEKEAPSEPVPGERKHPKPCIYLVKKEEGWKLVQ